jgi:NADPH-dependent 2,4-dienoyl-CoA reductase/sulfur reductase-like enzyme/rhodanese-related sulfurtransferase
MADGRTIVIIGGVAGGASAAARLRRLDESAEIVLLERGEHVSFANCGLPYHISGEIEERNDLLVQTAEGLRRRFRLDVRNRHEVLSIHRDRKVVVVRDLRAGREFEQAYDSLILSPGAAPIRPSMPGSQLPCVHTLRNLGDMDRIKAALADRPKGRALLVGGGFIGLEMAEALRRRGWDVLLAEKAGQLLGPADPEMAVLVARELRTNGVEVLLRADLRGISQTLDGRVSADFGDRKESVDLVLLAIGVRPETALAKAAGLELGERGGIRVDGHMRTSDPDIFAVGDAVEVRDAVTGRESLVPLAGPANRQGRIAADNLAGIPSQYPGTQGTAIVRVFDLVFAMTGASEKALNAAGMAHESVYLHPNQHAGYFPGATALQIKLLFDPAQGRILGAQAAGKDGVDKRMDVLATAIKAGMTVHDLEELELAYAPPFGSAKDPVNFLGFVAANVLAKRMGTFSLEEAAAPGPGQVLLDVRTPGEFELGAIPGAVNIPVDALRARLAEIPKDKEILVYCRVGLRGYIACRILAQSGFRARNLSGGWLTWEAWLESRAA